jgi:hypothetical protein
MITPRVYVSAFEVDPDIVAGDSRYRSLTPADLDVFTATPGHANIPPRSGAISDLAIALARGLLAASVDVVWFRDFWDYPKIEEAISTCTGLVAVTDAGYFSSTGKAIELACAAGQRAHGCEPIRPIPVFLVPLDDSHKAHQHLVKPDPWIVLPAEPQLAVHEIVLRIRDQKPPSGAGT